MHLFFNFLFILTRNYKTIRTQFIDDTQYNNAGFQKGFYENLAESPISISLTHIMLHTFPLFN